MEQIQEAAIVGEKTIKNKIPAYTIIKALVVVLVASSVAYAATSAYNWTKREAAAYNLGSIDARQADLAKDAEQMRAKIETDGQEWRKLDAEKMKIVAQLQGKI
jgi:hypothetical protein